MSEPDARRSCWEHRWRPRTGEKGELFMVCSECGEEKLGNRKDPVDCWDICITSSWWEEFIAPIPITIATLGEKIERKRRERMLNEF